MGNKESSIQKQLSQELSRKKVQGVWSLPRTQAIFMVGQEMDIPVIIMAEEGEKYALRGREHEVEKDDVYVEIGPSRVGDLGKFWRKVDQIKPIT